MALGAEARFGTGTVPARRGGRGGRRDRPGEGASMPKAAATLGTRAAYFFTVATSSADGVSGTDAGVTSVRTGA